MMLSLSSRQLLHRCTAEMILRLLPLCRQQAKLQCRAIALRRVLIAEQSLIMHMRLCTLIAQDKILLNARRCQPVQHPVVHVQQL